MSRGRRRRWCRAAGAGAGRAGGDGKAGGGGGAEGGMGGGAGQVEEQGVVWMPE